MSISAPRDRRNNTTRNERSGKYFIVWAIVLKVMQMPGGAEVSEWFVFNLIEARYSSAESHVAVFIVGPINSRLRTPVPMASECSGPGPMTLSHAAAVPGDSDAPHGMIMMPVR